MLSNVVLSKTDQGGMGEEENERMGVGEIGSVLMW